MRVIKILLITTLLFLSNYSTAKECPPPTEQEIASVVRINTYNTINNNSYISGYGSGVNLGSYIVTAKHVIKDADSIKVDYFDLSTNTYKTFDSKVVVKDDINDLALISSKRGVNKINLVAYTSPQYNDEVWLYGYPQGKELKGENGFVAPLYNYEDNFMVNTDIFLIEGQSGGPLLKCYDKYNRMVIVGTAANYTMNLNYVQRYSSFTRSYHILNLIKRIE